MKKELRKLLLPDVSRAAGSVMGRRNVDKGVEGKHRDMSVPINRHGYDAGGAYWGVGAELRCEFVIVEGEVTYRRFYRKGE